jgi:predicted TIM-barrel fold metal-dependent hydrolase
MTPIFDKVEDCQRRINKRILVTVHSMADSSFDTPDAVATIAKRYPELAFALVHMGQVWGGFGLMNVVRDVPNLYLDATWVPNLALITAVVEQIGPRRVIAGTDAPWGSFRAKMVSIEEAVIDPDDRALVLGGNLADLFGIAPIEASGEVLGGVPREFEASGETP